MSGDPKQLLRQLKQEAATKKAKLEKAYGRKGPV